jgi:hypothetical protein
LLPQDNIRAFARKKLYCLIFNKQKMKKLLILSAFVVLNLLTISCTEDGQAASTTISTNPQADGEIDGPGGGQTGNPPVTPPPPPGIGH